eukprot:scaffold430309_cov31-Prasinocladus_malaysianus.AAC.1
MACRWQARQCYAAIRLGYRNAFRSSLISWQAEKEGMEAWCGHSEAAGDTCRATDDPRHGSVAHQGEVLLLIFATALWPIFSKPVFDVVFLCSI